MQSLLTLAIGLASLAVVGARVVFPFSEVLQIGDLHSYWDENDEKAYQASFNCSDGCAVYVYPSNEDIGILHDGVLIANFTDIDSSGAIAGYELPPGEKYAIRAASNIDALTFYAVSSKAPNYGVAVMAGDDLLALGDQGRYATVLSTSDALMFYDFAGSFPSGYPKIYTAGYDTMSDVYGVSKCTPVYQARSQSNAEQSSPTILAPIVTIDFGFSGTHSVSANTTNGKNPLKSTASSTVYMSPGYVGCPFEGSIAYESNLRSVSDEFTLFADSLDIAAVYNALPSSEMVSLTVNRDILDFFNPNASSFTTHYNEGAFKVDIRWSRRTTTSGWTLQLDLGTISDSAPIITTTKSGASFSLFIASIVVFVFASAK